ncbi:hypothetical protein AAG906_035244 [Vitis piasezkii]
MVSASGSGGGGGGRGGGGGNGMFGRDLAWEYCSPVERNRNETICNFCGLLMKSGGINPNDNTKKCPTRCYMKKNKAKAKKTTHIEEIRAQLRGIMGARHTHVMDEDDDEDEEVYMYPTPCAAHCIDLIFKDIEKKPSVEDVIRSGCKITNFIYNHGWLLGEMRKYYGGDIVRLGATSCSHNVVSIRAYVSDERESHSSTTYFLNPRFQYRPRVGNPNVESIGQFGNELKLRDMEIENDQVAEKDYLDLLDISAEVEFGVDVERVLFEKVHSESFSKDTKDSFQRALDSHQELRRFRGETKDEGDNAKGDIGECQQSQYPMSQFTCENDFTHYTQDENHGSRRAGLGIGAIGKPYRGRERTMTPYNEELLSGSFESMSIGTQFSDSSNEAKVYPPYVMCYGQLSSSIDEEYGMSSYPSDA